MGNHDAQSAGKSRIYIRPPVSESIIRYTVKRTLVGGKENILVISLKRNPSMWKMSLINQTNQIKHKHQCEWGLEYFLISARHVQAQSCEASEFHYSPPSPPSQGLHLQPRRVHFIARILLQRWPLKYYLHLNIYNSIVSGWKPCPAVHELCTACSRIM